MSCKDLCKNLVSAMNGTLVSFSIAAITMSISLKFASDDQMKVCVCFA